MPALPLIISSFAYPICLCATPGEGEGPEDSLLSRLAFRLVHPSRVHMVPTVFEEEGHNNKDLGFLGWRALPLPQQYHEAVQRLTTKVQKKADAATGEDAVGLGHRQHRDSFEGARQMLQQSVGVAKHQHAVSHLLCLMLLDFCRRHSPKTRRFLQHLSKRTTEDADVAALKEHPQ
ncbi:hypothetical protein cyc_08502 [Cyclospora cayetanensis]|uniref:Uncharacterized protein n=1 Tax=Cyclospora cayetanensis TaxID=88456 RepID=A0A1D3D3F4_9EIME|nr:hypothetical protein cyc_08502 [Cyclospora cayetanensis]